MKTLNFLILLLLLFCFNFASAQEICNNALDDDGDGLVDLNDSAECVCQFNAVNIPSLLPNPSFEKHTCLPVMPSPITASSLCAEDWNKCGWGSVDYLYDNSFDLPNFIPQPFPDGKGALGMCYKIGYGEWPAANLSSPLLAGKQYVLNFNITGGIMNDTSNAPSGSPLGKIEFFIYGSNSTHFFPLNGFDCPDKNKGFEPLGKVIYDSDSSKWSNLSITFTPSFDINSIAFGAACDITYSVNSLAYLEPEEIGYIAADNLILNSSEFFLLSQGISQNGLLCDKNKILSAHPTYALGFYQWFKDGVALLGENDSVLKISAADLGDGNYSFKSAKNALGDSCVLSSIKIHEENSCDLNYTWPNVFTPNGDGYNEFFTPNLKDETNLFLILNNMSKMEFEVYDRWGIRVFKSNNEWPKWDGKYNGELTSPGTYFYIFKYVDKNNEIHFENGFAQSVY